MIGRREIHALGGGRVAHVCLPDNYDDVDAAYPTLVCLDAQWIWGTLCDASLNLALARIVPRSIVVGLGWDAATAKDVLRLRGEAYTPTEGEFPARTAPHDGPPLRSGGAPRFLDWLAGEALGFLGEQYRIDPAERTLVGHSLSGLFGLYTAFNRPELFARYLLASPSIWWDDRAILGVEAAYAEGHDDLAARMYCSVGADEEQPGFFPMIRNLRLLEGRLRERRYPSLDLTVVELPGEIHFSTIPAAVSQGLRALYAGGDEPAA
ncbi:MAG: alpha/beta hydrolase-fold protein [Acidimicrobiia bacterium]|nr:alpha/beta hydrolase-fold protein [Acidimicrobiia bacterium]